MWRASASIRTVRGWAMRSPRSNPEIVACVVPAIFASSDCESIRSIRNSRSRSPSTVCHPGIPLFYRKYWRIQYIFDIMMGVT